MGQSRMPDDRRKVLTQSMIDRILHSGRELRCEAEGCSVTRRKDIEVHHVVPARIRAWHRPDNLVLLCGNHHALVERYYWLALCRLAPDTAREIRRIARMFKARSVKRRDIDTLKDHTVWLWEHLNDLTNDPDWWRQVYQEAIRWASSREVIREVDSSRAIIEVLPWWRPDALMEYSA